VTKTGGEKQLPNLGLGRVPWVVHKILLHVTRDSGIVTLFLYHASLYSVRDYLEKGKSNQTSKFH
jgi:hypothetical protein